MDWEKEKLQPRISAQSEQEFNIVRRIYQQETLNRDANYVQPKKPFRAKCKKIAAECGFYACILNALPFVRWIPKYKCKDNIVGDLSAGVTTAIMHIPQGMAYALLAEVPPVVGLYMAFFPVLVYVFFSTSPHVSIGTFAVACLMTGKIISQHAHPVVSNTTEFASSYDYEPGEVVDLSQPVYEPLQVLSIVCLSVGVFQILMWIFRLGAVSTLLSEPLVSGFTTACAFQVIVTQIKDLLGITLARVPSNFKVIYTLMEIFRKLPQTNTAAVVMSLVACTIIAINNEFIKPRVAKRSRIPVPIELLTVVIGTAVSRFGHIHDKFGIKLVGHIPTGLPSPHLPPVELFPAVALDAFTITIVTYTITMSMAFMFAAKDKYDIDPNQELLALGAGNVFGAFFWCAPVCASLSRSFIQYQAGAKTSVTSIVSATLILLVLLWVGPVFEDLPRCVLASIIVVSLKGMLLQIHDLIKFFKLSILDAIVWLVTFLVTLFINIDIGLALGILANLATLYSRAQRPYTCLLGRVLQTDLYLDIKRYRGAEELPGIKIFHYCGGLNFATKNLFRHTFFRKVGIMKPSRSTENLDHEEPPLQSSESFEWDPTIVNRVQCVIIDATALCYVDGPGIKTLVNVELELANSRITVLLAGANGPVLEMIDRYNKLESQPLHVPMFPTVHDAVVFYRVLEAKRSAPPIVINSTTSLNPRE